MEVVTLGESVLRVGEAVRSEVFWGFRMRMNLNDGMECSNLSELTNIENDGEEVQESCGGEFSSVASVERGERRGLKREHGMCVESGGGGGGGGGGETAVEKPTRRLRSRIREQFALLRAAVPTFATVSSLTLNSDFDDLSSSFPWCKFGCVLRVDAQ